MAEALRSQTPAMAFDDAASSYDAEFAATAVGAWLRQSVWAKLAPFAQPGTLALDLGCGTGEDALWLARNGCDVTATDGSPAMLDKVVAKAAQQGLGDRIRTVELDLNELARTGSLFGQRFDLVLSNFGAINCVDDLGAFGRRVEGWISPGGMLALNFMGRFCAWESAYYGVRCDRRTWRRWRGRATADVGSRKLNVKYWSRSEVVRAFGPSFRLRSIDGIGTFLPPSYLFRTVEARPNLLRALMRWEQSAGRLWPLSRMGDHTLMIMRRLDPASSTGSPQ